MIFYFKSQDKKVFDEICNDISLKNNMRVKIKTKHILMLEFYTSKDKQLESYVMLKYGEYVFDPVENDRTPIPGVDYIPERKKK